MDRVKQLRYELLSDGASGPGNEQHHNENLLFTTYTTEALPSWANEQPGLAYVRAAVARKRG